MRFDYHRAACVLIEATFSPDAEVAARCGVSVRSIELWRARLLTHHDLKAEYDRLLFERSEAFVSELPEAILASIAFIKRSARESDPKDPASLRAITSALSALTEALIVLRRLDLIDES